MFEQASKLKLRFGTDRGNVTTEDLWDLNLENPFGISLDTIAKDLNRKLKESAEESFIVKQNETDSILELKFDIVKHIIKVKLETIETNEKAVEIKAKRKKIINILLDKEDDALKNKSAATLKKMLNEL